MAPGHRHVVRLCAPGATPATTASPPSISETAAAPSARTAVTASPQRGRRTGARTPPGSETLAVVRPPRVTPARTRHRRPTGPRVVDRSLAARDGAGLRLDVERGDARARSVRRRRSGAAPRRSPQETRPHKRYADDDVECEDHAVDGATGLPMRSRSTRARQSGSRPPSRAASARAVKGQTT